MVPTSELSSYSAASDSTSLTNESSTEIPGGTRQKVIALTAHVMQGDEQRCLAAGMDGYLTKPIRAQELYTLLESLFPQNIESEERSR